MVILVGDGVTPELSRRNLNRGNLDFFSGCRSAFGGSHTVAQARARRRVAERTRSSADDEAIPTSTLAVQLQCAATNPQPQKCRNQGRSRALDAFVDHHWSRWGRAGRVGFRGMSETSTCSVRQSKSLVYEQIARGPGM